MIRPNRLMNRQRLHACIRREIGFSLFLTGFSVTACWVLVHVVSGDMGWPEWLALYALVVVTAVAFFRGASE